MERPSHCTIRDKLFLHWMDGWMDGWADGWTDAWMMSNLDSHGCEGRDEVSGIRKNQIEVENEGSA